jgi:hypothetical protein
MFDESMTLKNDSRNFAMKFCRVPSPFHKREKARMRVN